MLIGGGAHCIFVLDSILSGKEYDESVIVDSNDRIDSEILACPVDGYENKLAERSNISVARKSIVAKSDIKKGEIFSESNITTKRPGTRISPMKWNQVIGIAAIKDFQKDELIEL